MPYVPTYSWTQSHIIKASARPTGYLLNGGSSASWTDAYTAAAIAPYIVAGVRVLYIKVGALWTGDGARDSGKLYIRRNGDTTDNDIANFYWGHWDVNAPAGTHGTMTMAWVPCDAEGLVEYKVTTGTVGYINLMGFGL